MPGTLIWEPQQSVSAGLPRLFQGDVESNRFDACSLLLVLCIGLPSHFCWIAKVPNLMMVLLSICDLLLVLLLARSLANAVNQNKKYGYCLYCMDCC